MAFGNVGSTTSKAIVYQLQFDDAGKVTASLYPYYDELFQAGNKMPVYKTNMTKRGYEDILPVDMSVNRTELNDSLIDVTVISNTQIQGIINGGADISAPNPVRDVVAKAFRDQIDITWKFSGTGLSNTIDSFTVVITKKDGTIVTVAPADTHYSYVFTRFDALGNEVDGYPEAADLVDWTVTVTPVNVYGISGTTSTAVHVNADADHYGTWRVNPPAIETKVVDRTVILQLSTPRTSSNREIYGDIRYQVRVRRGSFPYTSVKYWMHDTTNDSYYYLVTNDSKLDEERAKDNTWTVGTQQEYEDDSELDSFDTFTSATDSSSDHEYAYCANTQMIPADTEWKLPATNRDPYAHSDNYYEPSAETQDNRYVVASATYTQTMPLYYTDSANDVFNLVNTPYWFDVRCFNEAGTGSWYSGASVWSSGHDGKQCVALCTNIQDIVKANETAKQAYIEELSAITANLGEITDGSLLGSMWNYWTLTTKRGANQLKDYQGAFRVGDVNEYFLVEPVVESGQVTGYHISLKAGDISFSSSGVDLASGTYIYDEIDKALRLHLTARGITIQHKIDPLGDWSASNVKDAGTVQVRTNEYNGSLKTSLLITNDPENVEYGIGVQGITAYHFANTVLDESGVDSKSLSLNPLKLVDSGGFIAETSSACGYYDDDIQVLQENQNVVLHKLNIMLINGLIVKLDGSTFTPAPNGSAEYNEAADTSWGFTAEQVAAELFTPEE